MEILALVIIVFLMVGVQSQVFRMLVLKNLKYRCEFSAAEAHEGDEIFLIETVENRKLLPVPWLKANIYTSRWLEFGSARSVVSQDNRYATSSFYLKSYQKTTRYWKLKCLKRGVFTIDTATLVSGDLLGGNTCSIAVPVKASLKVYPAVIDLKDVFVPANYIQGDTVVKRWVIDDPFMVSGARQYNTWDPMNRIHWSATAREGRLMVKKNDFTSQLSLAVILNVQSLENEYFDAVDKASVEIGIKAAATVFDMALRMGMPVRFATNGSTAENRGYTIFTGEAAGREHITELLEILAKLELKGVKNFEDFLEKISPEINNANVIIISCYLSAGICEKARMLKAAQNRVSILVLNHPDSGSIPTDIDVFVVPRNKPGQ